MTWGTQNTKQEAFDQMDYAIDHGVNFFDTAELYPVPASADTYATTEVYIGKWLESRKSRDKIILASKIAGPGDYTAHIRKTGFKDDSIEAALDQSLKRLKTDYLIFINYTGLKDYPIILGTGILNILMTLGRTIFRKYF